MRISMPSTLKAAMAVWAVVLFGACAGVPQKSSVHSGPENLRVSDLIEQACRAAVSSGPAARQYPRQLEMLMADGRITVGLGIGTQDLGRVQLPEDPRLWRSLQRCRVFGRDVVIEARLILTNEDFRAALGECEVIFVMSHSRFGAGPVFLHDGKSLPFRMQTTPGYEIIMPDSEVEGYQGTVLRTFYDRAKNKGYTVFAPDGRDLERSFPLRGYQLLVMSTCSSLRHFQDEIMEFRQGYPTTAVFAASPSLMDTDMRVFKRLLYELFRGSSTQGIVDGINSEYRAVAWSEMKRGRPPWKMVEELFTLGIDTCPP